MENQLYTIAQIRLLEKRAFEQLQVPEFTLMSRAGEAAFNYLCSLWPNAKSIRVVCGQGNNGGDGFVLATLAKKAGLKVQVRTLGEASRYTKVTHQAFAACQDHYLDIKPFDSFEKGNVDIIVDAILGIGVTKEIEGNYKEAINAINDSGLQILAIDIPSGLNADTGSKMGVVIHANATVTFIGLKRGLFTSDGVDCCGQIELSTLDLPDTIYQTTQPDTFKLEANFIDKKLPLRKKNSNKGEFGHVLIIGGNKGMAGAARLAAEAALRVGAGLVSVASLPEHQATICAHYPEIMFHGVKKRDELMPLMDKATCLVIGPGLGQDAWAKLMLDVSLDNDLPKILDADALNLLGRHPNCQTHWILTPHPGEAARLLGHQTSTTIQNDRFKAIDELAALGGTWVLKGSGTLIQNQLSSARYLCPFGNPGMASGGMGDALSGIIAGLVSQTQSILTAVTLGVLVHALAGDEAAKKGERGLVASDLISLIRDLVNPYRRES